jgi:inhibitor of cysteine peptidase
VTESPRRSLHVLALLLTVLTALLALSSSALSSSPPPEPPPPTEIRLHAEDHGRAVQLREGEELVIELEANPSTGFGWQVDQGPPVAQRQSILVQTGESFETLSGERPADVDSSAAMRPLLGAPGMQTLRFQAAQAGETSLRLVYQRPWEDVPPVQEFSLSVEAIGPFTQPPTPMRSATQPASTLSVELGEAAPLGLPSAFNWCDLGACTPVKNQGGCGSCWAFSSVGPLESNILIHDSLERDLSEQYLLSCNNRGWDCDGGWFAHDYHQWDFVEGEPEAGSVYEADFPYVGWDAPCNPPHTHHEKIVDWEYVGNGIPPVADIKQAILDYGPVSVAVCSAGYAFSHYTGGIYEANECTNVNHAVVLVGWDDTQGTKGIWYLRNSWGPYWGEGGYMRIGYGINSVGYAANYVVYQPTCFDLDTRVYPAGAGTIVADPLPDCSGGYEPGTVVELTAGANPGWHFFTWGGDASGTDNPTTITMDTDKSVAAHLMCDGCVRRRIYPLGMKQYEHD